MSKVSPKSCRHLASVEAILRKKGRPASGFKNWLEGRKTGFSVYYDCVLQRREIQDRAALAPHVVYREYGIAGQYAGYFCDPCGSSVSAYHPKYRTRLAADAGRREGPFI